MKAVYARVTTTLPTPNGIMVSVQEGTHWSDEDPVVRAHPDAFSDDPRHGMLFSHPLSPGDYPGAEEPPLPARIEHATATPGDLRNVRRRG